jgi:hypothetical protein
LSYSISDFKLSDHRAAALVPFIQQHLTPISAAVNPGTTSEKTLYTATQVRNYNVADIMASDMLSTPDSTDESAESLAKRANQALKINPKNIDAQDQLQRALAERNPNQQP